MSGYIIIIFRTLLLALSCYGYLQFLRKRVKLEFTIALLFVSIGSVMFLAGILNLLPAAAALIFLGGLVLAAHSARNRESPLALVSPGTLFFAAACVFLLVLLRGEIITSYDDFSHWATAAKAIYTNNRFPNFLNQNISFTSYPLGSASFIYYVGQISGIFSEWSQLYTQSALMVGMLVSLFAFAEGLEGWLLAGAASVMLFCGNVPPQCLSVDTLLPLTALAGIALCIYEQERFREVSWAVIPFTVFLVTIKNSGALFAAIIAVFVAVRLSDQFHAVRRPLKSTAGPRGILFALLIIVYFLIQSLRQPRLLFQRKNGQSQHGSKKKAAEGSGDASEVLAYWKATAPQFLCPALTLLLWQKHVQLVYENGMGAKHSMSLAYWKTRFFQKSGEDVHTILSGMGKNVFSFSNPFLYILLLLFLLMAARKYLLRQSCAGERQAALIILASYVFYQAGLLGTYLFSMPTYEGVILTAYNRYHRTILLFAAGIVCIAALRQMGAMRRLPKAWARAAALLMALVSVWALRSNIRPRFSYYKSGMQPYEDRLLLNSALEGANVPSEFSKVLLIYTEEENWEYRGYILRYLLPNCRCYNNLWAEDNEFIMANWSWYECILVISEDGILPEDLSRWLTETFGTTGPFINLSSYK